MRSPSPAKVQEVNMQKKKTIKASYISEHRSSEPLIARLAPKFHKSMTSFKERSVSLESKTNDDEKVVLAVGYTAL